MPICSRANPSVVANGVHGKYYNPFSVKGSLLLFSVYKHRFKYRIRLKGPLPKSRFVYFAFFFSRAGRCHNFVLNLRFVPVDH